MPEANNRSVIVVTIVSPHLSLRVVISHVSPPRHSYLTVSLNISQELLVASSFAKTGMERRVRPRSKQKVKINALFFIFISLLLLS